MTAPPLPPPLAHFALPPAVMDVLRGLHEKGYQAFLVGGGIRDLLRGEPPKDFDVATNALPAQVQSTFRKVIPTGIEHGTVTVLSRGVPIEVTTFREEGEYRDGRRPSSVSFQTDITGDLSRRDFTINAIAFDPVAGVLIDPFGGQVDLAAKVIRCVRDPALRFNEDGLRALRAVRFAAVLGFALDPATRAAIPPTLPIFRKVSQERVRDELQKLLLSSRPALGLALLWEVELGSEILPEVPASAERWSWVQASPASLEDRLTALLHDVSATETVLQRLKLPNQTIKKVAGYVRQAVRGEELQLSDAGLRRWIAGAGVEAVEPILRGAHGRGVAGEQAFAARVRAMVASQPPLGARDLALKGNDVMAALGVGPSPQVGEATRFLVDQVLEHPEWNTPERLRELLDGFRARK